MKTTKEVFNLKPNTRKMFKIEKMKRLLLLIIPLVLMSCVSLNSHQTGRTVGEGSLSIFGNFNFGNIETEEYFDIIEGLPIDSGTFYVAEIGGLYGIKENLDLGFKINSTLFTTVMTKLQFAGNKESLFASSVGLDIGTSIVGASNFGASLSSFNSIHPTDYLAFTLTPRYTYLSLSGGAGDYLGNNIYGYSAGFIIGRRHQFSFEVSQFVNNTAFSFDAKPIISLGYIWKIK